MKYWKLLSILMLFAITINLITTESNLVSAEGDYEEEYEDHDRHGHDDEGKDGNFEDIGELAGWITIITMGTAGLIFPIRKSTKSVITSFPGAKKTYISISKFLSKYHIYFGIVAMALSIFHGVVMYLNEGELESEGIVGLGAVVLMLIASILGLILYKNKKVKSLRTTHSTLLGFAILIGLFHIFIS
ncbi:acetate and sugar kinases/Hsc70/actin family protein [Bacillus massilinigeriensis]|uniref:hypothetical protein n=1 Tax=Bacillus massilionigeriensis TaxID=1805475 RepID=UPI00096ADA56|nr:hypothetical protein [Bacillus massilionigeriensis]